MTATALPEELSGPAREFATRPQGLLIGDERVSAADGAEFETLDPATGLAITRVAHASAADVDRVVAVARAALESGPWPALSAAGRARTLNALAPDRAVDLARAAGARAQLRGSGPRGGRGAGDRW